MALDGGGPLDHAQMNKRDKNAHNLEKMDAKLNNYSEQIKRKEQELAIWNQKAGPSQVMSNTVNSTQTFPKGKQ